MRTFCDELGVAHLLASPSGGMVMVRPAHGQDRERIQSYFRALSPGSRYSRFLGALNEVHPAELARMTRTDRWNAGTLIAEGTVGGDRTIIGEARYALAPDGLGCEFALSVAEGWRRMALGSQLLADLARRAEGLGMRYLFGDVLRANEPMRALARKLGFRETAPVGDAGLVRITADLPLSLSRVSGGLIPHKPTASTVRIAA